jgi:hypothetical protein
MVTMTLYLIDPPSPLDTSLATWARHLRYVQSLPADTLLRSELIEAAEAHIATSLAATTSPTAH